MAAHPSFRLKEKNASAIADICRRLDGIPLAIELASARTKIFPPEEIAARLDDRFRLLTGGSRAALERHQTLFALIEWSHNLLSEAERVLLHRLSVFAGGWTFEAVQVICGDGLGNDVLDLLAHLVDKSLVAVEKETEEARYRLPETIRQYARDKLFEAGEAEQIRDRHLEYFLHFAETAEPKLRGAEQLVWLERVETEHDNLRTALGWSLESSKSDIVLQLAGALSYFWQLRGYWSEGQRWLEDTLVLAEREQRRGSGGGRRNSRGYGEACQGALWHWDVSLCDAIRPGRSAPDGRRGPRLVARAGRQVVDGGGAGIHRTHVGNGGRPPDGTCPLGGRRGAGARGRGSLAAGVVPDTLG